MRHKSDSPIFIVVDLFCGAGGVSQGFAQAKNIYGDRLAYIVACVNHDPIAIQSHWANHPDVYHFTEDITQLYGHVMNGILFMSEHMKQLIRLVDIYRAFYPEAKLILWASAECTNYSKAKGGQARDADSRTLPQHLDRYIAALDPDYFQVENVVEFMAWGPMAARVSKSPEGNQCCKFKYEEIMEDVLDVDEWGEVFTVMTKKKGSKKLVPLQRGTGKFRPVYDVYPLSTKNGINWVKWKQDICDMFGMREDHRQLNSANYGAYTSRNRLFMIFAKPELPIVWPDPTHAKKPGKSGMFGDLKKWKPVKDVLDFSDEGLSIFNRKIPLVDPSLERIEAGLIKFVAGGKEAFILKYNSTNAAGQHRPPSIDEPCPVVACQNRLALVQTSFIAKYYSGIPSGQIKSVEEPVDSLTTIDHHSLVNSSFLTKYYSGDPDNKVTSVDEPASTIRTKDGQSLIQCQPFVMNTNFNNVGSSIEQPAPTLVSSRRHPYLCTPVPFMVQGNSGKPDSKVMSVEGPARTITETAGNQSVVQPIFLTQYYSSGGQLSSVDEPARTLRTKDTIAKIQTKWFDKTYTGIGNLSSVEAPAGVIMPNDKHRLINCDPIILNPSHGGHATSTDEPCPVIIARQDKAPLYLIQFDIDPNVSIPVYDDDSEVMVRIKLFMAMYGISDIKMRMLKVDELLLIQGFPSSYKLKGNQSDKKKFIGNSVHPKVVTSWTVTLAEGISKLQTAA